jgi:hypothetical protein
MRTTDVKIPVFRIISDLDIYKIEKESSRMILDNWIPVGGVGKNGREWVQVFVRENHQYEFPLEEDKNVSKT